MYSLKQKISIIEIRMKSKKCWSFQSISTKYFFQLYFIFLENFICCKHLFYWFHFKNDVEFSFSKFIKNAGRSKFNNNARQDSNLCRFLLKNSILKVNHKARFKLFLLIVKKLYCIFDYLPFKQFKRMIQFNNTSICKLISKKLVKTQLFLNK